MGTPTFFPFGVSSFIRTDRATKTLPQNAQAAIATIKGGRIILIGVIGEVTTVLQAIANNAKLIANPDVGADVDICTNLDVNALAVGAMLKITGTFADALIAQLSGSAPVQANATLLRTGTLDLKTSANATGSIKWTFLWMPIDEGAELTAAA